MTDLTKEEMEAILFAHGKSELEFDADGTMTTVVPKPHYEIAVLDLAIDGWDAVYEMYRRLLSGNRGRNIQFQPRTDGVGRNTLFSEAYISFDTSAGKRVTGLYMVVVEFDPELKKVIGERMYTDQIFGQMWAENIGKDFPDLPGVSRIRDGAPIVGG